MTDDQSVGRRRLAMHLWAGRVAIEDDRIVEIGAKLDGENVVDISGRSLLPRDGVGGLAPPPTVRYSAGTAIISSRERRHAVPACTLAVTWSGVVAPAITEATPSWESSHPNASSSRV